MLHHHLLLRLTRIKLMVTQMSQSATHVQLLLTLRPSRSPLDRRLTVPLHCQVPPTVLLLSWATILQLCLVSTMLPFHTMFQLHTSSWVSTMSALRSSPTRTLLTAEHSLLVQLSHLDVDLEPTLEELQLVLHQTLLFPSPRTWMLDILRLFVLNAKISLEVSCKKTVGS